MPRLRQIGLAATAAALLAGCGGSDEPEPKRAVDARTEAIHFFPGDQPFVAFLDTSGADPLDRSRAVRSLADVPALSSFIENAGVLARSGLSLGELDELLTDDEPGDGIAASQAALGVRPHGRPSEDVLLVVVSDAPEEMEGAAAGIAAGAGLSERASFHEARVFAGARVALAVRDGVLVAGEDAAQLEAAFALRDADSDEQLDESRVDDALDNLPGDPPLLAFADTRALEGSDPGVAALALGEQAWLRALRDTAVGVFPETAGVRVEIAAKIEPEAVERGETLGVEVPVGEEPRETEISAAEARRLATGRFALTSPFRDALVGLAPLVASASLSDEDELRATILGSR